MPLLRKPLPCSPVVRIAGVPGGWLGTAPTGSMIIGGGGGGNSRASIASTYGPRAEDDGVDLVDAGQPEGDRLADVHGEPAGVEGHQAVAGGARTDDHHVPEPSRPKGQRLVPRVCMR